MLQYINDINNRINLDFINSVKKKVPKARYIKSESVKELERLHFERKRAKYPNVLYLKKSVFRDDSANGLTKCITAWLELHGHFAGRVNTTGIYDARFNKYRPSGARRGMADVTAVINGRHVSIEVKYGRDRISPDQLRVKNEVEAAGGVYIIASTFDNFLEQIKNIVNF